MDGTLKSWAVPKGWPTELGVKRSPRLRSEDHPIAYLKFEGTTPKASTEEAPSWSGISDLRAAGWRLRPGHAETPCCREKSSAANGTCFKIRSEGGKDVWLIAKSGKA